MNRIKLAIIVALALPFMAFTVYNYNCLTLPATSYVYKNIVFPSNVVGQLPNMDNMPTTDTTTDAGATLGRVLFYDVCLSQNNTISCASCHQQKFSFTDSARFSTGFNGTKGTRNAMSLMHARFFKDQSFFWDERAATLEIQVLMPIQNPVEMGLTLDTLVARVSAKSIYPPLFNAAFGSTAVTSDKISKALAQFVRSMNTFGSRYWIGVNSTAGPAATTPFANFTSQENFGKSLFMDTARGNCQSCHTKNVFISGAARSNGLDSIYTDLGVGGVTGARNKIGTFKMPSLMNIALTAPYMHDGRYQTLAQVINFYSDSIHLTANLSPFLKTSAGLARRPHYSDSEKHALLAFLNTLTDTLMTTDPRWSNPFCVTTTGREANGAAELVPVLSFSLYPNPSKANEFVNLSLIGGQNFNGNIRVYSVSGKLVFQATHSFEIGNNLLSLPITNLDPGMYILQLEKDGGIVATGRIVKQ
jgi:cytochrome c peroxidase